MSDHSLKKFKKVMLKSDFDETDFSNDFQVSHASKEERQAMFYGENLALAFRAAAVEIQRWWRGIVSRQSVSDLLHPSASGIAVYSNSKTALERARDVSSPQQEGKSKLLREYHQYQEHSMQNPQVDPADIMSLEAYSASLITDWWRRIFKQRRSTDSPRPKYTRKTAAVKIQKAWRRHIDIQVYHYYRDLINFKARGDPSAMLRCINPTEAKLLDAAAGIHIRFRLAGEKFPPNIYYKIFTHRPVQDMCANSPKNYAMSKLNICIDTNNAFRPLPSDRKQDWYKRVDNNGWRLVSDRLIQHIMADPVTWDTSQKKYEFHHNKLQRKQDVEKRRKQRKIEWMKRMYRDGMLRAKADDQETVKLIEGAAAGMVATVEAAGPEALEEWEVDELLDWTTSLNFEDYLSGWKDLATSGYSEKKIDDMVRVYASQADPYEFMLSTGPSRYNSTRQSHNTPVSSGSAKFTVNSR